MTIGTNLGRAGSPLPAAYPHNDCGAHGVTRPTHVPISNGNWYAMSGTAPRRSVRRPAARNRHTNFLRRSNSPAPIRCPRSLPPGGTRGSTAGQRPATTGAVFRARAENTGAPKRSKRSGWIHTLDAGREAGVLPNFGIRLQFILVRAGRTKACLGEMLEQKRTPAKDRSAPRKAFVSTRHRWYRPARQSAPDCKG
jgi:hypothetical protein